MFDTFYDFFTALRDARFGFSELGQSVAELYSSITQNSDIKFIWDVALGFLNPVIFAIPYVVILFLLTTAFFGKKMLPVLKFITFLVVGFVLGTHLIPPLLADAVDIPGWICGAVIGLLAAILYRFIYVVLYGASTLYCVYIACYNAFFIAKAAADYSLDKAIVSLVVAVGVTVAAFFLQKYVEMVGTAALSGFLIALTVKNLIFDYSTVEFIGAYSWIITLAIMLLVAVPGAYVQIKKRKRY